MGGGTSSREDCRPGLAGCFCCRFMVLTNGPSSGDELLLARSESDRGGDAPCDLELDRALLGRLHTLFIVRPLILMVFLWLYGCWNC